MIDVKQKFKKLENVILLFKKCLLVHQEKEWVKLFKKGTIIMDGDRKMIFVKGASEIVLEGCNQM